MKKTPKDAGVVAGLAKLPLRKGHPANTVSLREVLNDLQEHPQSVGLRSVDPAAVEIGTMLRRARVEKGMTQSDLAASTGIPQSAISSVERGSGRDGPSVRTLRTLATALGAKIKIETEADRKVTVGTNGSDDDAEPRVRSLFRVLRGHDQVELVGASRNADSCWPIVQSVLPNATLEAAVRTIHRLQLKRGGREAELESACGFWKVRPHSKMRMRAAEPVLALAYHGNGTVLISNGSSIPESDQIVVAESDQAIDVVNNGDEALSLMTMVIAPSIATG